ncbi:hypothetical protein TNCV_1962461, partial [Trichonephila clavipes]
FQKFLGYQEDLTPDAKGMDLNDAQLIAVTPDTADRNR